MLMSFLKIECSNKMGMAKKDLKGKLRHKARDAVVKVIVGFLHNNNILLF